MRLEGRSLREIGDHFGVSHERIRNMLPRDDRINHPIKSVQTCIYPNIRAWMQENRCTYEKFARMIGCTGASLRSWMRGESSPKKSNIDKLLSMTGLSYEDAFWRDETCGN